MTATPPTAASPMLELSRVVKSFGAVVALRSGSLTPRRRLDPRPLGENGAGKSTLVKIIAGLYRRDQGARRLEGGGVDSRPTAGASTRVSRLSTRSPRCSPTSRSPRTSSSAAAQRPPRARQSARDERATLSHSCAPGGGHRPRPRGRGLSIADQQLLEIAKASRSTPGPGHGRADRGPQRHRGRAALGGRAPAARRGGASSSSRTGSTRSSSSATRHRHARRPPRRDQAIAATTDDEVSARWSA